MSTGGKYRFSDRDKILNFAIILLLAVFLAGAVSAAQDCDDSDPTQSPTDKAEDEYIDGCSDGVDNDCNGDTDCNDPACFDNNDVCENRCKDDSDCGSGVCDTSENVCVECLENSDCDTTCEYDSQCDDTAYNYECNNKACEQTVCKTRNVGTSASFTVSGDGPEFTFDASDSVDYQGTFTDNDFSWDFGDGSTGTGETVSHLYDSTGTYDVTLTVDGTCNDATETKTIENNDECDEDSHCGDTSVCEYDNNCDPTAETPDCKDPSSSESVCGTAVCDTRQVQPEARFSYSQSGGSIDFDASDSYDPRGTIDSYNWDFGDGTTGSGEQVTHEYSSEDQYSVTLTVDATCGSDSETKSFLWLDFEGTEVDESAILSASDRWKLSKDTGRDNYCVYNGNLYSQGSQLDIGKDNSDLESGGHSVDREVCVNYDGDVGGEWLDRDNSWALEYIGNPGETDCDPDLNMCEDKGSSSGKNTPFWAPYVEGDRDDDYDPDDNAEVRSYGYHNKVQDSSDQYDSGPDGSNSEIDSSDNQWAFTDTLEDSIGNDGTVYDSGSCYPQNKRTSTSDPSVSKSEKAWGNSYAAVVSGDGTWIDPDDRSNKLANEFTCDITGPDRGYGIDKSGSNWNGNIYTGDIHWESLASQEQPKCGDDVNEFLLEELGQSPNGEPKEGKAACATANTYCVSNDGGTTLYPEGHTTDTNSIGEEYGRLKKDQEVCLNIPDFNHAAWVDQDYSQEACQENNLYGDEAVRWISSDYVTNHPLAVTGGIDDDLGRGLGAKNAGDFEVVSEEEAKDGLQSGKTSVPTGKDVEESVPGLYKDRVATRGFCAGDDESEYFVTQRCNTRFCQTDDDVMGISARKGSCVIGPGSVKGDIQGYDNRDVFRSGTSVQLEMGQDRTNISCFSGKWFDQWPVSFSTGSIEVGKGQRQAVAFELVNPTSTAKDFEVEMVDPGASGAHVYTFTEFLNYEEDPVEIEVPGQASKTVRLQVFGGKLLKDQELTVKAVSREGQLEGRDSVTVDVVEQKDEKGGSGVRSIPGIDPVHVLVAVLASVLAVFSQS